MNVLLSLHKDPTPVFAWGAREDFQIQGMRTLKNKVVSAVRIMGSRGNSMSKFLGIWDGKAYFRS